MNQWRFRALVVAELWRRAWAWWGTLVERAWLGLVYVMTWRPPFVGSHITKEQLKVAVERHDAGLKRLERLSPTQKRIARRMARERHGAQKE
jgi:hypothetical protein